MQSSTDHSLQFSLWRNWSNRWGIEKSKVVERGGGNRQAKGRRGGHCCRDGAPSLERMSEHRKARTAGMPLPDSGLAAFSVLIYTESVISGPTAGRARQAGDNNGINYTISDVICV